MQEHDYGTTDNGSPVPGGFTGTVGAFIEWLGDHLAYGGISVGSPIADPLRPHRKVRQIRMVTGGYSDDEALLGRVRRSVFALAFWESDHRGGLSMYLVPVEKFDSDEPQTWLEEPSDVFERVHRARTLVIDLGDPADPAGEQLSFQVPHGVELCFAEPERDICEPAGVLTVRGIPAERSPWPLAPDPLDRRADSAGSADPVDLIEELLEGS